LESICASSWTIAKNHCVMHGQKNVKNQNLSARCDASRASPISEACKIFIFIFVDIMVEKLLLDTPVFTKTSHALLSMPSLI